MGGSIDPAEKVVPDDEPWLVCIPDGYISTSTGRKLVEVKCPFRCKDQSLEQVARTDHTFFLRLGSGQLQLKKDHDYYYQIQGMLNILKIESCVFGVWTPSQLHWEIVVRDQELWSRVMLPKLRSFKNTVFPDNIPHLPDIRCFNQLVERNEKQLSAVKNILAGTSGQCPYIVFGPPGTGKTVTLVEAVKQVSRSVSGCHIICTAPSNTACDLLTDRLLAHINKRDIYRLNAPSRFISHIPAKVREVSNIDRDRLVFPAMEELSKYKIIVTTLVTAGRLVSAQFPDNHFTHVFMDEAGQAMEPETLIALSGLLSSQTRLIMAGDPKQLGPVIRSDLAKRHGLNISLLERLMGLEMYNMDGSGQYDQRCVC